MSVSIEITVTVPEIVLSSATVRHMIVQKMQSKTAPDLQRLFKRTVTGWQDPPNFLQKFTNQVNYVSTTVWPGQSNKGGKTYTLVNNGASPHIIRPRRARVLSFQRGYSAGTRPRVLSSRGYSRFGDFVTAGVVHHKGFDAREFDAEIAEQYAATFAADMQDAIKVATVRSK